MLTFINWPRVRAERCHRFLPEDIRSYLKGRGIPSTLIEQKLLGWDGKRITIPIFGEKPGDVVGFRYAVIPEDPAANPTMSSDKDSKPELYGWETLAKHPRRIVICSSEFDRLVLEANGIPAVASTCGVLCFLSEWAQHFETVRHIYICFGHGTNGAAKLVQAILPRARVAELPAEARDVTDFFVRLGRTKVDFEIVLALAAASGDDDNEPPLPIREFRPGDRALRRRAQRAKKTVRLHEIVSHFTRLEAEGGRLVGHCPFHDETRPSFAVYPKTDTYYCSGCGASGDAIQFLTDKESMTFRQALEALERFEFTGEIYGVA